MIYRTVDITPELTSECNVEITLADNVVDVTASIQKEVDVDAVIDNSIIVPNANMSASMIGVEADCITNIQTHSGDADYYKGEYEVTPKLHVETKLDTSGKLMKKDVTVLEIPYYETSNISGGTTVYIATEDL